MRQSPASIRLANLQRQQRRLVWLVFLFVIVILLAVKAADPKSWVWLTNEGLTPGQPEDVTKPVNLEQEPLAPGAFRLPSAPDTAQPESKAVAGKPSKKPSDPVGFDLHFPPELFANTRDDTLTIRTQELEAYYTILGRIKDMPLRVLEQAANKRISYSEIYNDIRRHRGELVLLEGDLRRLEALPAPEDNPLGIKTLYEGWLFTEAGARHPIRIQCTSLPPGMPLGQSIKLPVKFSGYVFKRTSYETQLGLNTAPLILGSRPRWNPPTEPQLPPARAAGYIFASVTILGLMFGVAAWRYSLAVPPRQTTAEEVPSFAGLENLRQTNLNELMAEFELVPHESLATGDTPHQNEGPVDKPGDAATYKDSADAADDETRIAGR